MFYTFAIRIIGKSQKHSFRSIMGFTLIISMMVATSGVISGFSVQIFGITEKAGESPSLFIQAKEENDEVPSEVLELLDHSNIKSILPVLEKKMQISSTIKSFFSYVIGVNITQFLNYYSDQAEIYNGRVPQSNESNIECLAGINIQTLLGSSKINITNVLNGIKRQFNVIGLVRNVKEFQSTIIIEKLDYCVLTNRSMDLNSYQRIKIRLKNSAFIEATISDITKQLTDYMSILTIKPEQQADVFASRLFSDIIDKLNLLFGVLFFIALIRVFHTVSWFVRKYERDLLIMRSMGLSKVQTVLLVVFLAEIIGNAGFLMGIFFGILIPPLIFSLLAILLSSGFFPPDFPIPTILPLLFFSNIVSITAAIYPAIFIMNRSPSLLSLSTHGLEK